MIRELAPGFIAMRDHGDGFDSDLHNRWLDSMKDRSIVLRSEYLLDDTVKRNYPNIHFKFDHDHKIKLLSALNNYNIHPVAKAKHFLCSFNGMDHVSRKLLTAALHKAHWFSEQTCSKNFTTTVDEIDGYLFDYVGSDSQFYRKFFLGTQSPYFLNTVFSFGHTRFDHGSNIYALEAQLTSCFVNIVSETMATSYYPFVTEKFLYSVITRGLFVAYAQPGWHEHLETFFGFKKYKKIFDYQFDTLANPIVRLVELITMLSKFSALEPDDWTDLIQMEFDTIEHNIDHYRSGRYLENLRNFDV